MTPSELAAELETLTKKASRGKWYGEIRTNEHDIRLAAALRNNLPTILQALDRTAGPVEWTERDEKILKSSEDTHEYQGWVSSPLAGFLTVKLRAFVEARGATGPVEDTERLDWLEQQDASIGYCDMSDEPSHWIVSEDLENESPIAHGYTLREAIDAARAAQKGAGR